MASIGSAARIEDVQEWGRQVDQVAQRIGARFPRSETRDRVRAYLAGILGPVQRKNAWQVAEQIGDEVYGAWELRRWLEEERRPCVLAVRANQHVWAGSGQATVAALVKAFPGRAWHEITIAAGGKGPRRQHQSVL